jgi:hypothetical protein
MRSVASASVSAFTFVFVAAIVAACGTSPNNPGGFNVPEAGGGSSSGGSSGGSRDSGAVGTFGDGRTKDSGPVITPPKGCDSSCATAGGSCQNNVCVITENPGAVSTGTQGQLQAGGTADSTFKWLYPYDNTVFPRGLLPPTFQFDGAAADAMYIHITAAGLDYKGYFAPSGTPLRQALPAASWSAVVEAAGPLPDQLKVEITKISSGAVTGPITETWPIAQGSVRGTIYYETYNSTLAGGVGGVGIMQISPGATKPVALKSGCANVCHTASADGSTLVASGGSALAFEASASYDLKNAAAVKFKAADDRFSYGGLYPDGSFAMSATNYRTWLGLVSGLRDTTTGAQIPAAGWDGVLKHAGTPAFSPDGSQMAFIHEDKDQGHTISTMGFTLSGYSFANLVDLATDTAHQLAWPSFTPDGKWVAYQAETPGSCTSGGTASTAGPFETDCNSNGDLYIVDLASQTSHRLDALDGYTGSGTTSYLPANDPDLNFAPTFLPEAVGGYFWVVFTSHRAYGNLIASMAPGSDGTPDEVGQLWVAAIDLNPTKGVDPSHPGFYLDAQEITADNLRGFWVLPPCQAQGASCTSGDQCCAGFCRPAGDGGPLECVPPPGGCANEYEKCTTSSDCCDSSDQCINGFCAQPAAQ